jgi:hypothetical protein
MENKFKNDIVSGIISGKPGCDILMKIAKMTSEGNKDG